MKIHFFGKKQGKKILSILIESSVTILLDCGCPPGKTEDINIPDKLISKIDAIFISHAHLDHWGYLPWMIEKNFDKPVFMTPATEELLETYAFKENYIRIGEEYKSFYREYIFKLRDLIKIVPFGTPINIENLKITFLPANHILGSAQILIEDKKSDKQILYTGDFNPGDNNIFQSFNFEESMEKYHLCIKPNLVLLECSNVDLRNSEYKRQEKLFIRLINDTYNRMGNVLIPCKALGTAQEFLIRYINYCLNKNLSMPSEIFTVGSLLSVNEVYFRHKKSFKDLTSINFFKTNMLIKNFNDYIKEYYGNMEDLFFDDSREYGIKLFLATGGNLNIGSSQRIYNKLKDNSDNLIITLKYPHKINCRAKNLNLKIFSLHGNFDDIMKYIENIERLNSSTYCLLHGSINNLNLMNHNLQNLNIKSFIPKIGDKIKIGV